MEQLVFKQELGIDTAQDIQFEAVFTVIDMYCKYNGCTVKFVGIQTVHTNNKD